MSLPTTLLWDFDGLVADTESPVYESWRQLFASHGQELDLADWVRCVGTGWDSYHPEKELERKTGRSFDWPAVRDELKRAEAVLMADLEPLPGVRERLDEAVAAGINCAVASSSPHRWVDPWIERFELGNCFHAVVCLEDANGVPKPAPDLFQLAASLVGDEPSKCLVLEDSLNGLKAAKAAGMRCCVVPNRITASLDFEAADLVVPSLGDRTLEDLLHAVGG